MASKAIIRDRLENVIDPCSAANGTNLSIIEMGILDEIVINENHVHVELMLTSPMCTMVPYFVKEIHNELIQLPEITEVEVSGDNGLRWTPSMLTEEAELKRKRVLDARDEAATEEVQ